MGIAADAISEVVGVPLTKIEPPLTTIEHVRAEFLWGEAQIEGRLLILLNLGTLVRDLTLRKEE